MRTITTLHDLDALRREGTLPGALLDVAEERLRTVIQIFREEAGVEWSAEEFGAFYVVEPDDGPETYTMAGLNPEENGLIGACWEVVYKHAAAGAYEVFIVAGNDGGPTFFVPDEPWLPAALAAKLEDEATPAPLPQGLAGDGERLPF